jgi:ADP-ribose pyrophosphatase YjhB (NUDIX family)
MARYFRPIIWPKKRQMYKIYINGTPVFLTTPENAAQLPWKTGKLSHNTPYLGKKKFIYHYLDLLEKNTQIEAVVLHSPQLDQLWADFQSCFKVQEAAGGFVLNPAGKLLVFFRRGSWDMPKGKIDPGETPEQAALREVQEETGLKQLVLADFLCHTYHTFQQKGQRILKKTWWYRMHTTQLDLTPQTEEDIEQIEWVDPGPWLLTQTLVYGNIRDVIQLGLG